MVVETSQEAHRAVVDGGAAEHNAAGENSIGDGSIGGEGMMKNQVTLPASMVEELESGHDVVESLGQELRTKLYEVHKLQDKFEQAVGKQKKAVKNAKSEFGASKTQIAKYTEALKDWESLMPTTGGWFTRAFLGVHNVRFHRKKERMLFKQDYELFKQRTAPVIILLCLVALYFDSYRGIHIVFQLYLAYYYVNLSLREGILQKNGSNIKPWWSIHHYISMLSAVLLLTWPSSASYNLFAQKLHLFGLYMGVVQIFQTRYQLARLYTLRSLGKASEMDVTNTDSSQIHWSRGMQTLLPIIIGGQLFQCYIAVTLFRIYAIYASEYQVLICGLFFFAMFLGNASTTVVTILEKNRVIKKRKD
mmetsp:Transcript_1398/g.2870  ORF Transcript_1398/g.2870 Transcript_1398/m.2870 type:complete len:362 (-) Transcript_1398:262-1347(-)